MDILLLVCLGVSFIATYILTSMWIKSARRAGLVGRDMHKVGNKTVAEMGGLPVVIGFLSGLLLYVGHLTFFQNFSMYNITILGVISTLLLITIIGIMDDILGWKIGLRQYQKPLLCLFAALPMMMINSGHSVITVPLLGLVDIGLFYPLLLVPIAISGAANAFNLLGGYNGLEAGQGAIILSALGIIVWLNQGMGYVAMIAFAMVAALIAFLFFNSYPAKVFPGDTLTYSVGALVAIVAILGNAEKAALFLFLLYFVEFALKARGLFRKESFAKTYYDTLKVPEKEIHSLTHFSLKFLSLFKKTVKEREVVYFIHAMQLIVVMIVIAAV